MVAGGCARPTRFQHNQSIGGAWSCKRRALAGRSAAHGAVRGRCGLFRRRFARLPNRKPTREAKSAKPAAVPLCELLLD
jgi:hypothetical protein